MSRLQTLLFLALIALVGVASFGLGRLSATEPIEGGLVIHQSSERQ